MLLHLKYNCFYATVHRKGGQSLVSTAEHQDLPADKEQGLLGERESDVKRTLKHKRINLN